MQDINLNKIKPGRRYYGLGALVVLVGIVYSAQLFVSGISEMGGEIQQVVVPGADDILLNESGEYTIFYENYSSIEGKVYITSEDISGLRVEVINKTTGFKQPTYPPSVTSTYSIGNRRGNSILAFKIDQPGLYELSADYPPGREGPELVLAVGHGPLGGIFSSIRDSIILFLISLALGAGIIIFTYMKRQENIQRSLNQLRLIRGE